MSSARSWLFSGSFVYSNRSAICSFHASALAYCRGSTNPVSRDVIVLDQDIDPVRRRQSCVADELALVDRIVRRRVFVRLKLTQALLEPASGTARGC